MPGRADAEVCDETPMGGSPRLINLNPLSWSDPELPFSLMNCIIKGLVPSVRNFAVVADVHQEIPRVILGIRDLQPRKGWNFVLSVLIMD